MGLAPYGEPRYVDIIKEKLIEIRDDGSFRMDMRYFDYCAGLRMTNREFAELFGGPERTPESRISQREMDLARSVQAVTEEILLKMAAHVHQETGKKNLVLAGGVALNCVANGRILRESPFASLWIQPCAGDGGNALGAALFAWHQLLRKERVPDARRQKATYLGPSFSDDAIQQFLDARKVPYTRLAPEEVPAKVAELLASEKVVGWHQGRMEFGPRALGGRSILGDPRSREMQSVLNLKIKFRESFRPFAPTALADHADDYFDLRGHESPYMLLVADVLESRLRHLSEEEQQVAGFDKLRVIRSELPAITHVDNSARVQTVRREDHPLYYDMIRAFYERTGCPVVINTSFNVRGEPIVCTPEESYTCFMRTRMDYLCLGSFLLNKEEQEAWEEEGDWREEFELD
jgi:carbamoyltransferase